MTFPHKSPKGFVLAPMEGVTDAPMRALLSECGGFDYAVAEFVRVSGAPVPARVLRRYVPELANGSKTPSGLPVQVQLLGGQPGPLAETARIAVDLGALGIDLNFGCPAPTVNRHDGGATLLKYPERVEALIAAVRAAVPSHLPVSAKLRLGWDSMDAIDENARRARDGGASWVTIHGRTKVQGYIPPAYWGPIGRVRSKLGIPVIANGEIWSASDFEACRGQTECTHFMLGRGALGHPTLALELAGQSARGIWAQWDGTPGTWAPLFRRYAEILAEMGRYSDVTFVRRCKQWIRMNPKRRAEPWVGGLLRAESVEALYAGLAAAADEGRGDHPGAPGEGNLRVVQGSGDGLQDRLA